MSTTMSALTVQFLAWIETGSRTYEETMEAWRSSCPRMPVWEDAVGEGLVTIDGANAARQSLARVDLTAAGRRLLQASRG